MRCNKGTYASEPFFEQTTNMLLTMNAYFGLAGKEGGMMRTHNRRISLSRDSMRGRGMPPLNFCFGIFGEGLHASGRAPGWGGEIVRRRNTARSSSASYR